MDGYVNSKARINIRITAWPNIFCMMALLAIGCTPYLGYNVSNLVKLVIAILWVTTTFMLHPFNGKERGFEIVLGFIIYLILQFLYSLIGVSREIAFFLARFHLYLIPIAMVYIYNYYNTREIKLIWMFFFVAFSLNLASNIFIGVTQGEYAFKVTDDRVNTNAGNTAFVVACMLFIPLIWMVIRRSRGRFLKLYSMLLIVSLVYYILLLNTRATALIILMVIVLGFFLIEISKKKQQTKGKLVFRMLLIVGVAAMLISPILNMLSDAFTENVRMLSRIEDLSFVVNHGNVEQLDEGSLYTRCILWMASIGTFFSSIPHFLFGVGESVIETDVLSLLDHGVGNHSEFFDLAARYGIIGIIIYYFILKNVYKFMNGLTADIMIHNYMFVILLGVLLFGFVNNLTNTLTTMMLIFFMLPTTVVLINRKAI